MDLSTFLGFLIGILCFAAGIILNDGQAVSFFSPTAALIVLGGTIGAVIIACSFGQVVQIPGLIFQTMKKRPQNNAPMIEFLVNLSGKVRSHGFLVIESAIHGKEIVQYDPLLKNSLELLIDGTDPDVIKSIVGNSITSKYNESTKKAATFETAASFAPTMGIIGTLISLIQVLNTLQGISELGPAIAGSFIGILYGIASASLIWQPIGLRLKENAEQQKKTHYLILEGIVSLQEGEAPMTIRHKLRSFNLS